MSNTDFINQMSSLLLDTINLQKENGTAPKLFAIQPVDLDFANTELASNVDEESKIDILIKLFIAFFLETIPEQVVDNLTNSPEIYRKNDVSKDYMVVLAGLMHRAKIILQDANEIFAPYLVAYKEFVGDELLESDLNAYFSGTIEDAIQKIINFN